MRNGPPFEVVCSDSSPTDHEHDRGELKLAMAADLLRGLHDLMHVGSANDQACNRAEISDGIKGRHVR